MVTADTHLRIIESLQSSDLSGPELRQFAMELLDELPDYNWSGIYLLCSDELHLAEYVGAETDHTRIKVGVGVCGTAVAEDKNQVIEDVRELDNYLACSTQTRSELVVLIRKDDTIIGQIDIDGHRVGAFDDSDEALLTEIAQVLTSKWTA